MSTSRESPLTGDRTVEQSQLVPVPPAKSQHRNPNFVAKLAAETNGGTNPLLFRLYSSSLPPQPGQQPGVPNILSTSSTKKVEPLLTEKQKSDTKQPAMKVYTQPVLREEDLRSMLLNASVNRNVPAIQRRQTPPSRLVPLESPRMEVVAAAPAATLMPKEEAPHSPLHIVSRFRTTTANTPKEFTYLKMRKRGDRDLYNPYDLQVVSHKDIDPMHYFTVSAAGVTKFDEGESEFIDLKAWEREFQIYHKLVRLDVFKMYKKWKSFHVWRKLVRRMTMQTYRNHLNDNLFLLNPDLTLPLRQVRDICLKFQEWRVYNPATDTRTLDQYINGLQKQLDYIRGTLDRTIREVKEIIEKACKEAMLTSAAARERELQHGANALEDTRKRTQRMLTDSKDAGPQKASYIEQSQKRAVCRRLTSFIRLCDYMVINSLVALAMKACRDANSDLLYPRALPPAPEPTPLEKKMSKSQLQVQAALHKKEDTGPYRGMIFITDILFSTEDEAIVVRPNVTSFTQAIDDLVSDYVKTVSNVPRLAQMEAFKVYTEQGMMERAADGEVGLGPDVGEMVTVEEEYKVVTRGIRSSVTGAFQIVENYAHTFESFRKMYLENCRLDPEEVKQQDPPLDWFREQLQNYKQQSEDIEKIPNTKDVAIFAVKTDRLRDFFTPSPVQCLEAFNNLLPVIAREKNNALLEDLQNCNRYLETLPSTVEEFAEYQSYTAELDKRMDTLTAEFECLKELFNLLDGEKIRIDDVDDQTYRTGTRPQFEKLRQLMQQVDEGRDSQIRFFAHNIDEQLDDIKKRMKEVVRRSEDRIIEDVNANIDTVITLVTELQSETDAMLKREKELTKYQDLFGHEMTPIAELREEVAKDINDKVRLWTGMRDWDQITKSYTEMPLKELDPTAVNEQINKFFITAKQVSRTQLNNPVVSTLKLKVEEWRQMFPVIQAFKNKKMKKEHWEEIDEVVGKIHDVSGVERKLSEITDFTLGLLLENNVMHVKEEILRISVAATEEYKLTEMLSKAMEIWVGSNAIEFQLNQHKEQKDTYVFTGTSVEEITAQLDETLIVVSTIASSKYCVGGLKNLVDRNEQDIRNMQGTLEKWLELQRSWMYLENIFSSSEITKLWKSDAKMFEGVDRHFRDLMRTVHSLSTAAQCLLPKRNPNLKADLDKDNKILEKVLANLEKNLEVKRRDFPRFYFLSNDDLLDILAKIRQPDLIMTHMLKMFDGIKSLTLTPSLDITHMNSMEGERVELQQKNIKAKGHVEQWLVAVEKEMFSTLRKLAKICVEDFEVRNDRGKWMFQHAAQLVLTVSQMYWSRGVESALGSANAKEKMKQCRESNYRQLADLTLVTGQKLSRVQRSVLATMITLDVHGRDLVDDMVDAGVSDLGEFDWTKQVRFYWEMDTDGAGNIFLRQNNSRFVYGYEYIGAQGRLVITPLTDRIYMTITGALKLNLGAAPAGPAGTGKTETVKDLAKNMARQCIVFNCSEGVTYKMMEKFFSGLIQTGAWSCLDEFNRINIEVLSVIATQVLEIKTALDHKLESFVFQGQPRAIPIRYTYGVFVTMNPGYAGRTELPDNLKILFRPVAVMTPDFRMIAEVILYSEGFKNAKDLSLKITQLYKLSSEQLSPQDHYDFGMRALKSILVMAGDLKRSQQDVEEDLTLIVACNDANVPKFVADDLPLFKGIMLDLFPGATFPERDYVDLLPAMHRDMEERVLIDVQSWVSKNIQYYETTIVRHGVMLVGATGTGKSESRTCLANALTDLSKRECLSGAKFHGVQQLVINPKSVFMWELYGLLDPLTNEWRDGHLARIAKDLVKEAEVCEDHRWIVFDGPVDTLWIESLNSVLDDSKLLCLDSGERIKLADTIHMTFEVADLAVASPATVSRCGMVYYDENDMPIEPPLKRWSETKLKSLGVPPLCREYFLSLLTTYMPKGLEWLKTQNVLISGGRYNVVESCCILMTALITCQSVKFQPDPTGEAVIPPDDPYFRERNDVVNMLFAFAFIWSVGGNVDSASADNFDAYCRDLMEFVPFPSHGSIFDFFVEASSRRFISWETKLREYVYDNKVAFFDILVPTVDTVRYSYLAKTLVACQRPLLFSGQSGVGKSVIMTDCLNENKAELQLVLIVFQFSAKTTSPRTQELIESKLKQKRKNILGAPPERHCVLFIDDLNMPALEEYGASPPIELIRQIMGNGGFFDRKIPGFWKHVQDLTVVSACGPPEGGRNPVTKRLTRLFHLLQIPNLSDDSMKKIFLSILSGFFHDKNFSHDVKELARSMIFGGVEMFQRMRDELRPRPSTPHYTFNLRDLAKLCQGLMQATPRVCSKAEVATRLWLHEAMRCFHDRLINAEDRRFFSEQVVLDILKRLFPGTFLHEELFEGNPIVWGDFLRLGAAAEDRVYEECSEFKKLYKLFDEYLDDYNNIATATAMKTGVAAATMNLVFFKDHIEHLVRIARVLRQPRGNMLLVGVGGSGKRSLTRLACSIMEYRRVEIQVGRGYGMNDFHESLLEMYEFAGVKQTPLVFLISDNQIVNESMVEDINNILNSGEVPALFPPDERDRKINQTMEAAREKGYSQRDEIWTFFIQRVRENLHIVFAMSPVGDSFRTRCRQFPSLTNCCAIDWFNEWPEEALRAVAERQMLDIDLGQQKELRAVLASLCVDTHMTVARIANEFWEELRRRYYTTPTSYLEFISLYQAMLEEKRNDLTNQMDRLRNGKHKMKETNETIAVMRKQLEEKQPLLEKASKETKALLEDIQTRKERASVVHVSVSAQQAEAAEQQQVAAGIEADAKGKLDEAMPIVEAAIKALDAIDKSQLVELKALAKPPPAVEKTLRATMTLFEGLKLIEGWGGSMEWSGAKEFLGDTRLLEKLKTYDRDNIKPIFIQRVQKFIEDPEFIPDIVEKKGSFACRGLCTWVRAMNKYYDVSRQVAPLKASLHEAQEKLAITNAKLHEAEAALKSVEDELAELQRGLLESTAKKERLERDVNTCRTRLQNAESLSSSLKNEAVRWEENIQSLDLRIERLPVDIFLSAACVAYTGVFTPLFRKRLVAALCDKVRERGVPLESFSLVSTMGDPMEILSWQICSLPTDENSTENAIIISQCVPPRRWPLLIDPQCQATKWITQKAKQERSLRVIKQTDHNYLKAIELAIQNGSTILLDEVGETLDPALEPLLQRQIFAGEGGASPQITIGSGCISYSPSFRFYMVTRLSNPHYLPDVCIKVTLVNFTVTMEGLEDQMLGETVYLERRALEEEKNSLIQLISDGQKNLKKTEDMVLDKLKNAQGNILDNDKLIQELKAAQVGAVTLAKRQEEAKEKIKDINDVREHYRTVAKRSSVLYFVLAELAGIDPMYQYSLDYFKKLAAQVVESTPTPDGFDATVPEHLHARTEDLKSKITEATYTQVCRGLFNKDKITLSLLICTSIGRNGGEISEQEWQYFVRATALVASEVSAKPASWISDLQWGLCDTLGRVVPCFKGIASDVKNREELWHNWISQDEPHSSILPGGGTTSEDAEGKDWETQLNAFQKILLVRCWREEKLFFALTRYIANEMGKTYTEAPRFSLPKALEDSTPGTPIIFILSQGSDPMDMMQKFAKEHNKPLSCIALGQGQGEPAKKLIEACRRNGEWAMLQNCHLSKTFMPELQTQVSLLSQGATPPHPGFRLWLTSMPADFFPVFVLQNSVKITNEPPSGIRANMLRCYSSLQASFFDTFTPEEKFSSCQKEFAFKKLLYGLCFFHSLLLERKKFGALGWNTQYEWNDTDFDVSAQWLVLMLKEQSDVPWSALQYIIGQINYGGRVTDPCDKTTIATILQLCFNRGLLQDGVGYSFSRSGKYRTPPTGDAESYINYVLQLSSVDDPEVFGMHENANLRLQLQLSQALMGTVLEIQPRLIGTKGGGPTPEELVSQKCREFEEVLPETISKDEAGPHTFTVLSSGLPNSMSTVLSHELVKFNALIVKMKFTLGELQKAMKGLALLSDDLDKMYLAFLNDQVPKIWKSVSYTSLKPLGAWFREFVQKVHFIRTWVRNGEPISYWLPGFFNPPSFMTGALQAYARQFVVSVDKLSFSFKYIEEDVEDLKEKPEAGSYVHGIFTDSWRYDKETKLMTDCPMGETYSQLPIVHFLPEPYHKLPKGWHKVPMYRTTIRTGTITPLGASTNFILFIEAPTDKDSDYWTLKGAACVTALNV